MLVSLACHKIHVTAAKLPISELRTLVEGQEEDTVAT